MLGRVPVAVAVLLMVLGVATAPASGSELRLEASAPTRYAYRDAFGETEHYLVIAYRLRNTALQPVHSKGNPLSLSVDGLPLNDGFRPLVQTAFCRERGCPAGIRSTPELQAMRIEPGRTIEGLAIFRLSEPDPEQLMIRIGNGAALPLRRATGSRYVPLSTAAAPRTAGPEAPPDTREARRHDGVEPGRDSWGIMKSSIRAAGVASR